MFDFTQTHRGQIEDLCRKFRATRLELFGSAATANFDPAKSDLDFFVEFEDLGWNGSSDRYFGLLHGLEDLLHRKIDLVERKSIQNRHFFDVADTHRQLIYAAPIAKAS
jgi:predicted nucleotidyltransferase